MRNISLLLATTMILGACAASDAHDPVVAAPPAAGALAAPQQSAPAPGASASAAVATGALQLAGSHWQFSRINGQVVAAGAHATLAFDANGHASGHAGCNSYGGSYQQSANTLHFGALLSTKMACLLPAGAMQTEQAVFNAMRATAGARMDGSNLILLDADGNPLATLQSP